MKRSLGALALVAALFVPAAGSALKAFPGAEGFGSDTPGGRRGQVLFVNTLSDHDDGVCDSDCTLREAIAVTGPRIVLFRIGGTITLDPLLGPLAITEPYITIAGQSAPGGGIQIRNNPDGVDGARAGVAADSFESVVIDTNDVVIRHLRVRPGPLTENPLCTGPNPEEVPPPPSVPPTASRCVDANDIRAIGLDDNASNVVLDHLSLSWSSDELVSLEGATAVTLQWSILSEGMNYVLYAGHFRSAPDFNGKGIITGNAATARQGLITGRLSLHHDAWVHNSARNPQVTTNCLDAGAPLTCASDTVNNVVYNWWKFGILSGNTLGHHFGNVEDNYIKEGLDSASLENGLRLIDYTTQAVVPSPAISVFHQGNRRFVAPGQTDEMAVVCQVYNAATGVFDPCDAPTYAPPTPYATPAITSTSAETAFDDVLADAGANLRLEPDGSQSWNRDANDQRVLDDIAAATGDIIQEFADFPGWPTLAAGTPPTDTDADGMPDVWETIQCLDPNSADDSLDPDGDVYTNVEEFLNGSDATDTDGDGALDHQDNCPEVASALQTDDDGDGFGDVCDCDYSGDGDCDNQDQARFNWCVNKQRFPSCDWADADQDLHVDADDQAFFAAAFANGQPGPGAAACAF